MEGKDPCLIDPNRDCFGLIKARELEKDLTELKNDVNELRKQNANSHERMFDQLHLLERFTGEQKVRFDNILSTLENLKASIDLLSNRLAAIEQKPAKRWEGIVGQILSLVVGALAAFLLAKMGLGG